LSGDGIADEIGQGESALAKPLGKHDGAKTSDLAVAWRSLQLLVLLLARFDGQVHLTVSMPANPGPGGIARISTIDTRLSSPHGEVGHPVSREECS
jgi:hypothetical protein